MNTVAIPDDYPRELIESDFGKAAVEDGCRPALVCMASIEPRPVDWLWQNRIAAGRVTVLVGRQGLGKSYLTCDMAARVSTGTAWPDGSHCARGSVLFITAEDDPHDTIRPRLDAHGADVSRIHLLSGVLRTEKHKTEELSFTLGDTDILGQSLESLTDCRLVVIDPIGSFLGGRCDAHRDNDVRAVLAPVAKLAEQHGAAVVMVAHRRKSMAISADDTVLGSRAFTALARNVWHLSSDPSDDTRRLLLPGKANLAPKHSGLAFKIAGEPAAVCWESDPVFMSADDALIAESEVDKKDSAVDEAVEWLRDALADGPKSSEDLKAKAKADGVAWRTIGRAKDKLSIHNAPVGFGLPWAWHLPTESAKERNLADSDDSAAKVAKTLGDCPVSANNQPLAETGNTLADSDTTFYL